MLLRDVIPVDGRIFLKSEWGPISDEWPAVSFSKRNVGERLRREFKPGRDVILYVGTSDPETTKDPSHRQRVLSAIEVEPNQIHDTRNLIPPESWARAQQDYARRWEFSMAVLRAWDVIALPLAKAIIPETYRALGWRDNWGNVVEVATSERDALLNLELSRLQLKLQSASTAFDSQREFINLSDAIKREIARIVEGINERVARSGTQSLRTNPIRVADSNLQILLWQKTKEQDWKCALCGGPLVPSPLNKLLGWSADRIDSASPSYNIDNVHIVHLACNWAKNDASMAHFEDWLGVVRGKE